jgi:hypothetical protein
MMQALLTGAALARVVSVWVGTLYCTEQVWSRGSSQGPSAQVQQDGSSAFIKVVQPRMLVSASCRQLDWQDASRMIVNKRGVQQLMLVKHLQLVLV